MSKSVSKALYRQAVRSKTALARQNRSSEGHPPRDAQDPDPQDECAPDKDHETPAHSLETEVADLEFLLSFPELCPPELAMQYSPVAELPKISGRQPQRSCPSEAKLLKRFQPANTFEVITVWLYKRGRMISSDELTRAVLTAYGVKTMGELLSVLKGEYCVQSGRNVLEAIEPILIHYRKWILSKEFLDELTNAVSSLDPASHDRDQMYHQDELLDNSKWRPVNRFEQFMITIGNQYAFTDWTQVGPRLMRLYGDAEERIFMTRILGEYHYDWNGYSYICSSLNLLSHHLKPKTEMTKYVKAWLYYLRQRFWVLCGRPAWKSNDDLVFREDFHGDYHFEGTDGIWIPQELYDPEFAKLKKAEIEKKLRKAGRRSRQKKQPAKPVVVTPIDRPAPPVNPALEPFEKVRDLDNRIAKLQKEIHTGNQTEILKIINKLKNQKARIFEKAFESEKRKSILIPGATDERYNK